MSFKLDPKVATFYWMLLHTNTAFFHQPLSQVCQAVLPWKGSVGTLNKDLDYPL